MRLVTRHGCVCARKGSRRTVELGLEAVGHIHCVALDHLTHLRTHIRRQSTFTVLQQQLGAPAPRIYGLLVLSPVCEPPHVPEVQLGRLRWGTECVRRGWESTQIIVTTRGSQGLRLCSPLRPMAPPIHDWGIEASLGTHLVGVSTLHERRNLPFIVGRKACHGG